MISSVVENRANFSVILFAFWEKSGGRGGNFLDSSFAQHTAANRQENSSLFLQIVFQYCTRRFDPKAFSENVLEKLLTIYRDDNVSDLLSKKWQLCCRDPPLAVFSFPLELLVWHRARLFTVLLRLLFVLACKQVLTTWSKCQAVLNALRNFHGGTGGNASKLHLVLRRQN